MNEDLIFSLKLPDGVAKRYILKLDNMENETIKCLRKGELKAIVNILDEVLKLNVNNRIAFNELVKVHRKFNVVLKYRRSLINSN